jgi:hypothetical protein
MRLTRGWNVQCNGMGGGTLIMMGLRIANICLTRRRVSGGASPPGTFLSACAKGFGSLICLRSRARMLLDGRTAIR